MSQLVRGQRIMFRPPGAPSRRAGAFSECARCRTLWRGATLLRLTAVSSAAPGSLPSAFQSGLALNPAADAASVRSPTNALSSPFRASSKATERRPCAQCDAERTRARSTLGSVVVPHFGHRNRRNLNVPPAVARPQPGMVRWRGSAVRMDGWSGVQGTQRPRPRSAGVSVRVRLDQRQGAAGVACLSQSSFVCANALGGMREDDGRFMAIAGADPWGSRASALLQAMDDD